MGWASCSEDNAEAVTDAQFLANRRAAAPVVKRIRRSTPAGSRNGGSEPQLAKAEVSHASLKRLMRHFDRQRNV
jgi:hypothetical protein